MSCSTCRLNRNRWWCSANESSPVKQTRPPNVQKSTAGHHRDGSFYSNQIRSRCGAQASLELAIINWTQQFRTASNRFELSRRAATVRARHLSLPLTPRTSRAVLREPAPSSSGTWLRTVPNRPGGTASHRKFRCHRIGRCLLPATSELDASCVT